MRVKMLRTLGVGKGQKAERVEGATYDVPNDEGKSLIDRGLAEEDSAKKAEPAAPPKKAAGHETKTS